MTSPASLKNTSQNIPQTVLIILDGWGYREDTKDNAVAAAKTPNFDKYWKSFPHTLLIAGGEAVGLPEGQMGNSEIGHTTIGAGRAMDTDLVRIKKAINSNEYAKNPAFQTLFTHVKTNHSTLHVMGLIGDGGVHAHSDHLFAFLRAAKNIGIERVAVHIFTDGRDTPPQSAVKYIQELEAVLEEINSDSPTVPCAFIASISGRFYAMDRDNNWDRLARVEEVLFEGKGHVCEGRASEYIAKLYEQGKVDEHIEPIICKNGDKIGAPISENDAVFFFNFRADRARMLSTKIMERRESNNIQFATQTSYGSEYDTLIAFPSQKIETTLAREISNAGYTQAHIAETEKFPHATYFLNGGVETPHTGEAHELLASRKDVKTHDEAPKMRAEGIADKAIEHINNGTNFIFINFANPDMVGHTANVPAIIEAVEEVDLQLGRVIDALTAKNGIAFITADHGNAEVNVDQETGIKHTAHTLNPVPAIITSSDIHTLRDGGTLADIAPTILALMKIDTPNFMTGENLVI